MIYRVERRENPFVQVDKGFINDKRLGYKEKGILLYFLSKPDGWNFYAEEIASNSTDGLSAVKAGIHNLMKNGYITRGERQRNEKGQLGAYEYIVKEVSATCENPTQVFPTQGNPTQENLTLINNNTTNNNRSNIYNTPPISPKGEKSENEHSTYETRFNTFWEAYPRKVGKKAAENLFKRLKVDDGLLDKMLKALEWQKKSDDWTRDGGQYIPHPRTWLNQGRWEDEPKNSCGAANKKGGDDYLF